MGGGAYGEGIPLHVGQETLLHQLGLLEPHEAVHLEQLVDLREGGGEGEGRRGRREEREERGGAEGGERGEGREGGEGGEGGMRNRLYQY